MGITSQSAPAQTTCRSDTAYGKPGLAAFQWKDAPANAPRVAAQGALCCRLIWAVYLASPEDGEAVGCIANAPSRGEG